MLRNYFVIAWRNLWRNKTFAIIKLSGLSLGLMVCMLIFLYTKDEISFDRFHQNKDQLYRLVQRWKMGDNPEQALGITNSILGETFAAAIPEIKAFVRVNGVAVTAKQANDVFTENPFFVDNNYFSVFSFGLTKGDKKTVLKDPYSVVLSKDLAKKYFGTTDPVGKVMQLKMGDEFENFTVTGVAENAPQNSTLQAGMFIPFDYYKKHQRNVGWIGGSLNTFLLLSPNANRKAVEKKMQALFDQYTKEDIKKAEKDQNMSIKIKLGLQPLTDIHLSKEFGADNGMAGGGGLVYSYILTSIAIFILIIACINFINLAIAQSLKRSKEIGIRKVVGGTRSQLIKQFLAESFVVSSLAFAIAIVLTAILLPYFNELANKKLSFSYLADGWLYLGFFALLLVTSFVAGFYPSLVLSSFQPVKVLYSRQKLLGRNYLTRGLVVLQFALAIFLIIGTIGVNSQLNFLLHKSLGYDSKNLVKIELPDSKNSDRLARLFANELSGQQNITDITLRNGGRNITGAKANGKNIMIEYNKIDTKYLPTFKIPIIAGRNFSPDYPSDTSQAVIVNESFLKEADWNLSSTVGQTIRLMDEAAKPLTVVGVIKDYHFTSLKEKITPEIFTMDTAWGFGEVWVKIKPTNVPQTLGLLQTTFKKLMPYFPYSYQFMDDINAKNYEAEEKWKKIISIASGLFIFISCIGLLGLVILSIEQRTKEIGIRKVLGAAISRIVLLISKEFLLLISLAIVVAIPVGYYFMNKWLQDFPYRIHIGWWIFGLAGALVIILAAATMSFQAIKAAIANPVKSLRTE
jgi:ABC-type antimicrobial peptide transport system permease subunit